MGELERITRRCAAELIPWRTAALAVAVDRVARAARLRAIYP